MPPAGLDGPLQNLINTYTRAMTLPPGAEKKTALTQVTTLRLASLLSMATADTRFATDPAVTVTERTDTSATVHLTASSRATVVLHTRMVEGRWVIDAVTTLWSRP